MYFFSFHLVKPREVVVEALLMRGQVKCGVPTAVVLREGRAAQVSTPPLPSLTQALPAHSWCRLSLQSIMAHRDPVIFPLARPPQQGPIHSHSPLTAPTPDPGKRLLVSFQGY